MVIMSDGEAFGLRLTVALLVILMIVLLFVKLGKQPNCHEPNPSYSVQPAPVTVTDTLYLKDTVYVTKMKHDTVYITNRDTI